LHRRVDSAMTSSMVPYVRVIVGEAIEVDIVASTTSESGNDAVCLWGRPCVVWWDGDEESQLRGEMKIRGVSGAVDDELCREIEMMPVLVDKWS
jgi:hypothetical protein